MIVSIGLGAVVTWISIDRHNLLPSLYADTHNEQPTQETEAVVTPVSEDTTGHDPAAAEREFVTREQDKKPDETATEMLSVDRKKYLLIAGSFSSETNALRYQTQLESVQIHSSLSTWQQGTTRHFRVVVGSADSRREIADAKKHLADMGLTECWVLKQQTDE